MQGSAKVNFGHAVVLVVDAEAAHARVSAPVRGVGAALSRRELALAGTVLDEGRLLLIALNKADALPDAARAVVTDALNAQARPWPSPPGVFAGSNVSAANETCVPALGCMRRGLHWVHGCVCMDEYA